MQVAYMVHRLYQAYLAIAFFTCRTILGGCPRLWDPGKFSHLMPALSSVFSAGSHCCIKPVSVRILKGPSMTAPVSLSLKTLRQSAVGSVFVAYHFLLPLLLNNQDNFLPVLLRRSSAFSTTTMIKAGGIHIGVARSVWKTLAIRTAGCKLIGTGDRRHDGDGSFPFAI